MGDDLVRYVDRLIPTEHGTAVMGPESSQGHIPPVHCNDDASMVVIVIPEEDKLLSSVVECRICQEDDNMKNMDAPCACSGSLKYAHMACLQRWVNVKGDLTCEICHELYKPGYIVPSQVDPEETTLDISRDWSISDTHFDLHDSRLFSIATARHQFLDSDYDEYAATDTGRASFLHSAAVIFMALLLFQHALAITDDGNDDTFAFSSIFTLRALIFLLPCYVTA